MTKKRRALGTRMGTNMAWWPYGMDACKGRVPKGRMPSVHRETTDQIQYEPRPVLRSQLLSDALLDTSPHIWGILRRDVTPRKYLFRTETIIAIWKHFNGIFNFTESISVYSQLGHTFICTDLYPASKRGVEYLKRTKGNLDGMELSRSNNSR